MKTEIHHKGTHNHPKPPPMRADILAWRELEARVNAAPNDTAGKIMIGSRTQKPSREIHVALANVDRLSKDVKTISNKSKPKGSVMDLMTIEKNAKMKVIHHSSFSADDGHITLQTPFMSQVLGGRHSCLQADSVYGMIRDPQFNGPINVTFTSGYCPVLERTIPMVISIMFGASELHYKQHFLAVFKSLFPQGTPFKTFNDEFPGMTCDFSDAERNGFELAVREHCIIPDSEVISLDEIYRYCSVHYKRSVTRCLANGAFVRAANKDQFKALAESLLDETDPDLFKNTITVLMAKFPKIDSWLNWYVHPKRGPLIFPALNKSTNAHMSRDTNAQESIGAEFKKLLPVADVVGTIYNIISILERYESSMDLKKLGYSSSYRKDKPKPKYVNDGRGPHPDAPATKTYNKLHSQEPNSLLSLLKSSASPLPLYTPPNTPLPASPPLNLPSHLTLSHSAPHPSTSPSPPPSNKFHHKDKSPSIPSAAPAGPAAPTRSTGRPRGGKNKLPKFGNINWNIFGIPWRINHPQFRATNTCPLDTTLMTWYFINRHGDAVLPDDLSDSPTGITLQKVVEYIQRERYDEARWIWCRDVLGLSAMASQDKEYDMYGSTERVFRDKLPSLFLLRKTETSICSSPFCPRPERTTQRSFASFDSGTSVIDQANIDGSLLRLDPVYSDRCHYEHPSDVVNHLDQEHWIQTWTHDEDGHQYPQITCRGIRSYSTVTFTRLPIVMVVTSQHYQANRVSKIPSPVLQLPGAEYHLVALIYKSTGHFRSISIIGGKYLWYDGMASVKVKGINRSDIASHMKGFFISEAWYLKKCPYPPPHAIGAASTISHPSKQAFQGLPAQGSPAQEPPALEPSPQVSPALEPSPQVSPAQEPLAQEPPVREPSPIYDLPSPSVASTASRTLQEKSTCRPPSPDAKGKPRSKRRRYYAYGFSAQMVGNTGALPTCRGCEKYISRGEYQLIHKVVTNRIRNFSQEARYHMVDACITLAFQSSEEDLQIARYELHKLLQDVEKK
jgi:hypothetical protein